MTNRSPVEEAIRLGYEAESILNTDVFGLAMDALDKDVQQKWAEGAYRTAQEREEAYLLVQVTRAFRSKLTSFIDNKKVEKDRLERAQKRNPQGDDA